MELITIIVLLLAIVGGFSIVAAFTPNKSDNAFMQSMSTEELLDSFMHKCIASLEGFAWRDFP